MVVVVTGSTGHWLQADQDRTRSSGDLKRSALPLLNEGEEGSLKILLMKCFCNKKRKVQLT